MRHAVVTRDSPGMDLKITYVNYPVTGRGGPSDVSRRGFHIFWTIGSQMAVRLSAVRAGHPLRPG
jgi:hypothetical protein